MIDQYQIEIKYKLDSTISLRYGSPSCISSNPNSYFCGLMTFSRLLKTTKSGGLCTSLDHMSSALHHHCPNLLHLVIHHTEQTLNIGCTNGMGHVLNVLVDWGSTIVMSWLLLTWNANEVFKVFLLDFMDHLSICSAELKSTLLGIGHFNS